MNGARPPVAASFHGFAVATTTAGIGVTAGAATGLSPPGGGGLGGADAGLGRSEP